MKANGGGRRGDVRNRRVLVVDDQQDIHEDFKEMLRPGIGGATDDLAAAFLKPEQRAFLPNFELIHATSGEQACEIVRAASASDKPIALAYVDIRMPPGIDGVETIHRIRVIDRDIEVVIMTAYTDKTLPEIVQDMDMRHKLLYIRKPFAREEIQQLTMALVEKHGFEGELAANNRLLETILGATGDAIAMVDGNGRLAFANRLYESLLGAGEGDLVGMTSEDARARYRERFRRPSRADTEYASLLGADRDLVEYAASEPSRLFQRATIPIAHGSLKGTLYVYRDVSKEAEVRRLRRELQSTYSFAGIIGRSAGMQHVFALMERAVDSDLPVLVRGESGTGKELVAKALHFNGRRKERPFVAVNCAALPEALVETELFGHERGAFTGALRRRIGSFERANGGTIFLDEIGDMPPALQAKLLRVLQEREIQRLGGSRSIPVDIQVIAATNQDLEAAMQSGAFREDLFYRIAAFPITIPPLRQRLDDVPLLAERFLRDHAQRSERAIAGISNGALRVLLRHDWPGNVRELDSAIGRAVLLEQTGTLQASSLLPDTAMPRTEEPTGGGDAEILPLHEVERRAVARTMAASGNNVSRAAQALGIHRATLHRMLKRDKHPASDANSP